MADHGELTFARTTTMNIAIASTHWSLHRTEISAHHIDERLTKGRASRLIPNQRCEKIALLSIQKHPARGADSFLSTAEINAADDHAAAIKTREFLLEHASREHPAKCLEITLVRRRFSRSRSAAFRRLKHPQILAEAVPSGKLFCRCAS